MQDDAQKRLETLKKALAIELKEKGYYITAAKAAANPVAKQLFERLALEEDAHAEKFKAIEAELAKGKEWPSIAAPSWEGSHLKQVVSAFNMAVDPKDVIVARSELDAMKEAMAKELEAYDMYRSRAAETGSQAEKKFYTTLAGEERMHHLSLLDSYEYLTDPAGWHTVKEKWSLEG
ncbi:MAG: ferritin family protein [Dehalococcoidia bacterium]|nr:ferritin family protein [Dehalococcoidia bacterium]